jgi:hypothetical protein
MDPMENKNQTSPALPKTARLHVVLLATAGTIAVSFGAALATLPRSMHAANGVQLGDDPSLLSEVRAPGVALLAVGALLLVGAFRRRFTSAATIAGAVVYLAYGSGRLLSVALDGPPSLTLLAAGAFELLLGAALAKAVVHFGSGPQETREVA